MCVLAVIQGWSEASQDKLDYTDILEESKIAGSLLNESNLNYPAPLDETKLYYIYTPMQRHLFHLVISKLTLYVKGDVSERSNDRDTSLI